MAKDGLPKPPPGADPRDRFPGRVTRLERLRHGLKVARFRADNPREGDDPRLLALIGQVTALDEFVRSDPDCRDLAPELDTLLDALYDIDLGRPVDWLKPKAKSGAPPLGIETARFHGWCAAVMEFLMEARLREKEAAEFVVKEGALRRELSSKRGNAAPPWQQVSNWRQRAMGPPDPTRDSEQTAYREMLAQIAARTDPAEDPRDLARDVLRAINPTRHQKPT